MHARRASLTADEDGEALMQEAPTADTLHLALGESAAGCLRAACRSSGIPGAIHCIPDDLSHGPLDDGRMRIAYLRACHRRYDDWPATVGDAFQPWHSLLERVQEGRPAAIVIWGGGNVAEQTFFAMACWWLRQQPARLVHVTVPGKDGRHYVAAHSPDELGDMFGFRKELDDDERTALAEDFQRLRRETGLLRRWQGGRVIGVPYDRYDPLLLECCTQQWTPAARVVGAAMGRCDGRNLMSDLFFARRLEALIDGGQVEASAAQGGLRDYAVRRGGRDWWSARLTGSGDE